MSGGPVTQANCPCGPGKQWTLRWVRLSGDVGMQVPNRSTLRQDSEEILHRRVNDGEGDGQKDGL